MSGMNIVTAAFTDGCMYEETLPLYQWDYGQILQITGLDLPEAYQVHFSNQRESGTTITMIGGASGVQIPDNLLQTGENVYAWIFLHSGDDDGETEYQIKIPVLLRPQPSDEEPTQTQQSAIDQAIVALNAGVEAAEGYSTAAATSATEAANSATAASESASATAQSAREAAASATAAASSEANAAASASQAGDHATSAGLSATHAAESAAEALTSAERAEQAAKEAGYMFFYIDENGDLIYQRTSNTQVDFYLSEGDLYVRASA